MPTTVEEKAQRAQQFLTGLLATVPDAQREQAQALFTTLGGAEAAAEHIAAHILRQEDYSRAMNETAEAKTKAAGESEALIGTLQEERTRLNNWWEQNSTVLKQAKQLMDDGKWPGSTTVPVTPTTPVSTTTDPITTPDPAVRPLTAADLDDRLNKFGQDAVPVMTLIPTLIAEHGQRFPGEVLNMDPLINHVEVGKLGLRGVYELVYKAQLEAIETKTREGREETLREEGRKEVRETVLKSSGPPYAFDGQVPATALDILEQPVEKLTEAQAASEPAALAAQYMERVRETSPEDAGWVG